MRLTLGEKSETPWDTWDVPTQFQLETWSGHTVLFLEHWNWTCHAAMPHVVITANLSLQAAVDETFGVITRDDPLRIYVASYYFCSCLAEHKHDIRHPGRNEDQEKRMATSARGLVWLVAMRHKVSCGQILMELMESLYARLLFSAGNDSRVAICLPCLTCTVATLSKAFVFQDLPQAVFCFWILRFTLKSKTLNNKDKQRK